MNIIGIIAEYNPFHSGHLHHIRETLRLFPDSILVAVMSGSFVQRGEPAIVDKWTRAVTAVLHGVNLVVELPTYFATSAAPDFAKGAVTLLRKIGATHLSFGSEIEEIETLRSFSDRIHDPEYNAALKSFLSRGDSYATASIKAGGPKDPNALLAAEYLRHAGNLIPIVIPRAGNHSSSELFPCVSLPFTDAETKNSPLIRHQNNCDEKSSELPVFSSAKAIRSEIMRRYSEEKEVAERDQKMFSEAGPYPKSEFIKLLSNYTGIDYEQSADISRSHRNIRKNPHRLSENPSVCATSFFDPIPNHPVTMQDLDLLILYTLRTAKPEELRTVRGISEGLEYRLLSCATSCKSTKELLDTAATKRYTEARLRRILLSALLGIRQRFFLSRERETRPETSDDKRYILTEDDLNYVRLLAYDKRGRELLAKIRDQRKLEIISKSSKTRNRSALFEIDRRAAALYASIQGKPFDEHTAVPFFLKKSEDFEK